MAMTRDTSPYTKPMPLPSGRCRPSVNLLPSLVNVVNAFKIRSCTSVAINLAIVSFTRASAIASPLSYMRGVRFTHSILRIATFGASFFPAELFVIFSGRYAFLRALQGFVSSVQNNNRRDVRAYGTESRNRRVRAIPCNYQRILTTGTPLRVCLRASRRNAEERAQSHPFRHKRLLSREEN